MGVCVDVNNNVFVGDSRNYAFRSITPAGFISTFFPSNGGAAPISGSPFTSPAGCAIDSLASNPFVYMVDSGTGNVWKTRYTGVAPTNVATGLSGAFSVSLDAAGNAYIADTGYNVIRVATQAGVLTVVAGANPVFGTTCNVDWRDGVGTNACFKSPRGVAHSAAGSCLYVADTGARSRPPKIQRPPNAAP
jgi:hypothetical protein